MKKLIFLLLLCTLSFCTKSKKQNAIVIYNEIENNTDTTLVDSIFINSIDTNKTIIVNDVIVINVDSLRIDSLRRDSLQRVNFLRITRIINGGYNGLQDRLYLWERSKEYLIDDSI